MTMDVRTQEEAYLLKVGGVLVFIGVAADGGREVSNG